MKHRSTWFALGAFAIGCFMGTPVWADHHEAAEEMAAAAGEMAEAAEEVTEAAGPIDINMADAATLQTLPGIGETKAAAIVAHREANGPFTTVEDLKNVKGIGDKTFEALKEKIMAGAGAQAEPATE